MTPTRTPELERVERVHFWAFVAASIAPWMLVAVAFAYGIVGIGHSFRFGQLVACDVAHWATLALPLYAGRVARRTSLGALGAPADERWFLTGPRSARLIRFVAVYVGATVALYLAADVTYDGPLFYLGFLAIVLLLALRVAANIWWFGFVFSEASRVAMLDLRTTGDVGYRDNADATRALCFERGGRLASALDVRIDGDGVEIGSLGAWPPAASSGGSKLRRERWTVLGSREGLAKAATPAA